MKRCLNIDWLEVYCLEPEGKIRDMSYYMACGHEVIDRGYGTRIYQEMFTLLDADGQPFLEIRRLPFTSLKNGEKCVLPPRSCHLRLVNRYLYYYGAAAILEEAIKRYGLQFVSITRADICLDFEYFDSGDLPASFVRRYLNRVYSKINQSNISAHGRDEWDGMQFNSLSWGAPSSSVTTKLYDKTLEIDQHLRNARGVVTYKPYIVQAWFECGLIDDYLTRTKHNQDGKVYKPRIWRLEFSIKSKIKNWVTVKNQHDGPKYLSKRNTLDIYYSSQKTLDLFASLVNQYFFFRYYQDGKRKYDCKVKTLFTFDSETDEIYKPDHPLTSTKRQNTWAHLIALLLAYRDTSFDSEVNVRIDYIIDTLQKRVKEDYLTRPFDKNLQKMLQHLMTLQDDSSSVSSKMAFIKDIMQQGEIW